MPNFNKHTKRFSLIMIFLFVFTLSGFAQQTKVAGTITYIVKDAVYTSLGRDAGIEDSTLVHVFSITDTIATLKVFATSSKSSVCNILSSKRKLNIGDSVIANVVLPKQNEEEESAISKQKIVNQDTTVEIASSEKLTSPTSQNFHPPTAGIHLISLQGRVSLQYSTSVFSDANQIFTQPGIVLNLRGAFNNSPFKFDVYANFRSRVTGTQSPFSSNSTSQTRLYRFSVDYDDTLYRFSVGRIIPQHAPSVGYIDGALVARRFNNFIIGLTAGFEPSYSQRGISTEYKKISLFGNFQSDGVLRPNLNVAYARTYFHSQLDREVVSAMFFGSFTNDISLSAQSEIDLRTKSGNNFELAPRLTNLFSNINYRFSSMFTFGLGYNSFRSMYSYSSVQSLPDSMLDRTSRGNMNVNLNFYLPYGISFYNTYSPRTSSEGFGKEFSNYSSISFSNLLEQGISARASFNINSTLLSRTRGIGGSLQKTFGRLFDVSARFQTYSYDIKQTNDTRRTQSFGIDCMTLFLERLTVWGSIEWLNGSNTNGYNFFADVSWRF
jgi:hypothetical protein